MKTKRWHSYRRLSDVIAEENKALRCQVEELAAELEGLALEVTGFGFTTLSPPDLKNAALRNELARLDKQARAALARQEVTE